jgi:iron complex transport system substrate-binding protein
LRSFLIAVAIGALLCGCSHGRINSTAPDTAGTIRLISLAPSLTEIAYAVDCGRHLVADTTYDDYPAPAKALPHVGDLAHVDLERIAQLRPTVVVALHDQENEGAAIALRLHVPVVYLPNRNIADLYADIAGVAKACGNIKKGVVLAAELRRRIDRVAAQTADRRHKPTVLYLLGLPGFTAGGRSYLNDIITLAGGVNVAGSVNEAYPSLTAEAILKADPDILIVSDDTHFGTAVRASEPWRSLRAVRDGKVLRPPNDSILERNGPRVVDGLEWLAGALR